MPKIKTHHWAGVTLSLKNMLFGIVPGMKYGWPKNLLHWHGIHESILDICATVPIHFVIADDIVAMEGNGPVQGAARELHRIVLADDPVAADATCARLMRLDPRRVRHIAIGQSFLGNLDPDRIGLLAGAVGRPDRPFAVLPEFQDLVDHGPSREVVGKKSSRKELLLEDSPRGTGNEKLWGKSDPKGTRYAQREVGIDRLRIVELGVASGPGIPGSQDAGGLAPVQSWALRGIPTEANSAASAAIASRRGRTSGIALETCMR